MNGLLRKIIAGLYNCKTFSVKILKLAILILTTEAQGEMCKERRR
jgi:hypothetical protein